VEGGVSVAKPVDPLSNAAGEGTAAEAARRWDRGADPLFGKAILSWIERRSKARYRTIRTEQAIASSGPRRNAGLQFLVPRRENPPAFAA